MSFSNFEFGDVITAVFYLTLGRFHSHNIDSIFFKFKTLLALRRTNLYFEFQISKSLSSIQNGRLKLRYGR